MGSSIGRSLGQTLVPGPGGVPIPLGLLTAPFTATQPQTVKIQPPSASAIAAAQAKVTPWLWIVAPILFLIAVAALGGAAPSSYEPVTPGVQNATRAARRWTGRSPSRSPKGSSEGQGK